MARYDREAARKEAQTHWNIPCRDGLISRIGAPPLNVEQERKRLGLGSDWHAQFFWNFSSGGTVELEAACFVRGSDPPVMFQGWAGLGDCAHFMSKCLQAGGLKDASTDFVPALEVYLRGLSITKTLAEKVSAERGERIIKTNISGGPLFKKGDVILYYDPTGTKIQGYGPIYHHSALYVGYVSNGGNLEGSVSCHTRSRFLEPWLIFGANDTDLYTLIHFSEDDPVDASLTSMLEGWWQVTWRGNTYFYNYQRNGRVSYGSRKPASTSQKLLSPEGTGYWFYAGGRSHVICWTKSGSVEEFTLTSSGNQSGKWNNLDTLSATKM
jgi:hypothetical protein